MPDQLMNTAVFLDDDHHHSDTPGMSTWASGTSFHHSRPVIGKGPTAPRIVEEMTHGKPSHRPDLCDFTNRLEMGATAYGHHTPWAASRRKQAGGHEVADVMGGFGASTAVFHSYRLSSSHNMGDQIHGAYDTVHGKGTPLSYDTAHGKGTRPTPRTQHAGFGDSTSRLSLGRIITQYNPNRLGSYGDNNRHVAPESTVSSDEEDNEVDLMDLTDMVQLTGTTNTEAVVNRAKQIILEKMKQTQAARLQMGGVVEGAPHPYHLPHRTPKGRGRFTTSPPPTRPMAASSAGRVRRARTRSASTPPSAARAGSGLDLGGAGAAVQVQVQAIRARSRSSSLSSLPVTGPSLMARPVSCRVASSLLPSIGDGLPCNQLPCNPQAKASGQGTKRPLTSGQGTKRPPTGSSGQDKLGMSHGPHSAMSRQGSLGSRHTPGMYSMHVLTSKPTHV